MAAMPTLIAMLDVVEVRLDNHRDREGAFFKK